MLTGATYLNSLKVLKLLSSILIKNVKTLLIGNMYNHTQTVLALNLILLVLKSVKL